MGGTVTFARDGAVATVTLSHPGKLNAISTSMWQALATGFAELAADTSLRCVVVRGAEGNFAAGADIAEFPVVRGDEASVRRYHTEILAPALAAIATCPHPTLAMIEGVCVGGGLEIACHCDLRIAAAGSRFGVPINRLGFPMAPGELGGLLALAGRAVTLEILLEGRVFDAAEAERKGLLTRVVAESALHDEVAATVQRLCAGAPLAARINKATIRRLSSDPAPLTAAEIDAHFAYAGSRDHAEGVAAFLAHRRPEFTGE
ncbi:putative enoyl-CoA hydratase echA8 [compost metagenome]|uniref:Enoyl-CoA hydratase-related protein n=1 Tax=Cupriavidus campinensis TaxID=151783 RepID=A0AAE9I3W8_9BURK|nr:MULTISPECIES: enoyl-CoA hydratase-related protein [Cupriavidus]TSP12336.1 enoyl-CoA hydratase/isomerase family protein [Cupriavidus campinensis]URF03486.1 enoyl-CoA hydratase-related protein [Cupriavidus campinensis]CAG2149512.1 putative enoyl-CoA hydratase echA8 [Cupriavidus campinensis]